MPVCVQCTVAGVYRCTDVDQTRSRERLCNVSISALNVWVATGRQCGSQLDNTPPIIMRGVAGAGSHCQLTKDKIYVFLELACP